MRPHAGGALLRQWLVKETAIESLREVTSETIEACRQELSGWKVSQATCDLRFAAAKTFMRVMNESGVVDADVAARVPSPVRRGCDRVDARPCSLGTARGVEPQTVPLPRAATLRGDRSHAAVCQSEVSQKEHPRSAGFQPLCTAR